MEIVQTPDTNVNLQQSDQDARIAFFAMIADPIRSTIIQNLLQTPQLSVNQLIDKLSKSQTLVSYHLRCLRECGLVDGRHSDDDKRKILYSLHDPVFILELYHLADTFLQTHAMCKDHVSCRYKDSQPKM